MTPSSPGGHLSFTASRFEADPAEAPIPRARAAEPRQRSPLQVSARRYWTPATGRTPVSRERCGSLRIPVSLPLTSARSCFKFRASETSGGRETGPRQTGSANHSSEARHLNSNKSPGGGATERTPVGGEGGSLGDGSARKKPVKINTRRGAASADRAPRAAVKADEYFPRAIQLHVHLPIVV